MYKLILFLTFLLISTAVYAEDFKIKKLGYTVQVGAYASAKSAENFVNKLQIEGVEAFYFKKDNDLYAVRFGDFKTKEEADMAAIKLVRSGLVKTYYISKPQEIVFDKPKPKIVPPKKKAPFEPDKKDVKPKPIDNKGMGIIVARTAERFVGIPYRWGGNNVVDGMDCSGFTRAVYNLCGVTIPRTSKEQFKAGFEVDKEKLKDGDLLFFGSSEDSINHVGIYIGDNKFVHAPKQGEDIKISKTTDRYFNKRFIGAKRYFKD